jgi:ferric-dicitrate binding protein FerR (iron transport regulator)
MVEVLGTQFTVHNRTGETHVVLREGKVKLNKASQTYIMKPNEMVRYSSIHREFVTTLVDAEQKISWKDNILIFQDETLQTVADRLEASHGLRIFFKNETVSKEIFNGSIPGDSVEVLFEKIEKLYGLSVTQNDSRTYTIE